MIGKSVLVAGILGALATSGPVAAEPDHVLAYAGFLELSGGDTRTYAGAMADVFTDSGIGLHADLLHVDATERADYAAAGLSYDINDNIRPQLTVGTSSSNRSTLPSLFVRGQVRIKPGHNSGWVITPAVTYRGFRDGQRETMAELQLAKYFDIAGDLGGYWVAQLGGETTLTSSVGARLSVNAALSTVRKSKAIIGLSGQVGTLFRDPFIGSRFRGRFVAVRPNVELPLGKGVSIVTRGEYVNTQLYDALGGSAGVKVDF